MHSRSCDPSGTREMEVPAAQSLQAVQVPAFTVDEKLPEAQAVHARSCDASGVREMEVPAAQSLQAVHEAAFTVDA